MKVIDRYHDEILAAFKEHSNEERFATVFFCEFNYMFYQQAFLQAKRNRIKTKFHIENIDYVKSNIPYFSWPPKKFTKNKDGKLFALGNKTGMFKITCKENDKEYIAIHCCFLTGYKNETIHLVCCSDFIFSKLTSLNKKMLRSAAKPLPGIYYAYVDDNGMLKYSKHNKEISNKTTYHKEKEKIKKDIEHFFKNLPNNIKFGEKGTRKALIAGPQGTGKSSLIQEILLDEQFKNLCLVFCSNLKALSKHSYNVSKYNMPSIAVLEDCENFFNSNNESSELLNFLSGPAEPKNIGGTYILFTTNHPQLLSDRIKHRPERIDDIFIVDVLDKEDSFLVTKMYFSPFLPENFKWKELQGMFEGYTGAEIMKIAQDIKREASFKLADFSKIDKKFIEKNIKELMNRYKKLELVNTSKTNLAKKQGANSNIGFDFQYDDSQ